MRSGPSIPRERHFDNCAQAEARLLPRAQSGSSAYRSRRRWLQACAALAAGSLLGSRRVRALGQDGTSKLVAFGDSLTAGFDLPAEAAFPAVLERALRAEGYAVAILNAGVSGDTASGGLARLDWSIGEGTDGVILALGANDMLRGIDPDVTSAALDAILARLAARRIAVLLAGMRASPSLGKAYKTRFDAIYPALAEKYELPLYPFFLDGVAGHPDLQLADGLHPNRAGVQRIVAGILPSMRSFLQGLGAKAADASPGKSR
jgi:acyl-CoA thioesterase-1